MRFGIWREAAANVLIGTPYQSGVDKSTGAKDYGIREAAFTGFFRESVGKGLTRRREKRRMSGVIRVCECARYVILYALA